MFWSKKRKEREEMLKDMKRCVDALKEITEIRNEQSKKIEELSAKLEAVAKEYNLLNEKIKEYENEK